NRKILDGVMESIGLTGDENAGKRLTVLRAIDKLDRLKWEGVEALLGKGRQDESGDITKGAGLDENAISKIKEFLFAVKMTHHEPATQTAYAVLDDEYVSNEDGRDWIYSNLNTIAGLPDVATETKSGQQAVSELEDMFKLLPKAGYGSKRIRFDPSVVRGLEYYTGPVYEVELLLDTKNDKGRPVRFGSVGGGGRYDGLVSRFRGEPVPATGFSIGVSRLQAALTALGKVASKPPAGPVLVTVFGAENVQASQKLAADLRKAGIRAELYLGNPKHGIGQQLKYADKRSSPCAVIQGPDEKAKSEVQLRDLIAGSAPSDLTDRDAYLKKQAEAQVAVKESELVEEVRKLLARHKIG